MRTAAVVLILLTACSAEKSNTPQVSKEPISVRGWIADIDHPADAPFRTAETEDARKTQLFQSTNVWVDNAPYVSGGIAENGSFLLLDVPPGDIVIEFSAPGAPSAKLTLKNVPGNADVFVPGIILKRDSVGLLDPAAVKVRMAARVEKPVPTNAKATIAGLTVPVMNVPYNALTDRHEYPIPPAQSYKPVPVR
jgi:hypothetical protein